uniref:p0460E08.10 protein n=1 Tax=Oryza sativa subsp. japonica TaxID=39947 RepID=Q94DT5_ORYSJ|nr:P0460E08.10 [Oryza sativa Japonica Group]
MESGSGLQKSKYLRNQSCRSIRSREENDEDSRYCLSRCRSHRTDADVRAVVRPCHHVPFGLSAHSGARPCRCVSTRTPEPPGSPFLPGDGAAPRDAGIFRFVYAIWTGASSTAKHSALYYRVIDIQYLSKWTEEISGARNSFGNL